MKSIDIFQQPFVITYKNKEKFSTFIGGLTSIFIIIIILSVSVLFSQNLYLRLNPQIISQADKTSYFPSVTLNTSNHILGFNFNEYGQFKNLSQYFTFEALSINKNSDQPIVIKTANCGEVLKNNSLTVESDLTIYSNSICLTDFNIPVFGYAGNDNFNIIMVSLYPCQNITDVICKPIEKINAKINSLQLNLIYQENLVQASNYSYPIKRTTSISWDYLDLGILKTIEFSYKIIEIETDNGLIFENLETNHDITLDNIEVKSTRRNVDNNYSPLANIIIIVSRNRVFVKRIYDKIQNVFANMGGVIKSMMIFGQLIVFLLSRKLIEYDMVNNFYDFSKDIAIKEKLTVEKTYKLNLYTDNKIKKKRNFSKIGLGVELRQNINSDSQRGTNLTNNLNVNNNRVSNNISSVDLASSPNRNKLANNNNVSLIDLVKDNNFKEEYSIFKNKSNSCLFFTSFEIFKSAICPQRSMNEALLKKSKFSTSAYKQIKSLYDINSIVKHSYELSYIKTLLMNEMQVKFFDYLQKPKFTNELFEKTEDNAEINLVSSLCAYYHQKQITGLDANDKKLFEELDKDLIILFDKVKIS